MKRLLKTLLAAIGILALVMVGAVVYVTTFFDPDSLKPRLIEVVREQSGLDLELEGPLSWSFYPRLGFAVEQAEAWLPGQQATDAVPFAAFRHGEVSLSFAPLLRGEIAIDGLTLDGLRLNLERDKQGRGNWEVLLERLAEQGAAAESALAAEGGAEGTNDSGGLGIALNIASVQLREGEVRFRDLQAGEVWRLDRVEISGRNVRPNRPFPLEAGFVLTLHDNLDWEESELPPRLQTDVAMESRVSLGLAEGRHVLEEVSLTTTTRLAGGDSQQEIGLRSPRLVMDAGAETFLLEEGQLDATLQHPALGKSPLPLALAFAVEADLGEQRAQLRSLELTGDNGLRLRGSLEVIELLADPAYQGQLSLAPLSLRPWLDRFGMLPATIEAAVLDEFALTSPIEGDRDGVVLPGLTLTLDESAVTGHLAADFDGQQLAFDLKGDRLNVDAYLPADAAGTGKTALTLPGITPAYAQQEGELVPAEWLSSLTLDGKLGLGELRLAGLDFSDVALELAGGDGRQRLTRFESGFYEGRLSASGGLDLRESPLRWSLSPRLDGVRLEPLLETLGESPAALRGRLTMEGALQARGNTIPALKRGLGGTLQVRLEEGAILDVNVSREMCTAVATLEGEQTSRDWHADTRFERAEASITIRDGTMRSDDLLITLPGIELGGEAQFDLVSEQFDLRAAGRFVDTADAACNVNPRLERLPFPVRCQGRLDGDRGEWCRLDREALQASLAELLRDEVGQQAAQEAEKRLEGALQGLDERLGEKAGGDIRKALRGLFE